MNYLKGKNVIISGASRGIGEQVAIKLNREGSNLALVARSKVKLTQLKKALLKENKLENKSKIKTYIKTYGADLTKEKEVKNLRERIFKDFKTIDGLINNVGVGKYGNLDAFSVEDYDWIMNTNLRSSFLMTKYFSPKMLERKQGHVVFIGSVAGLKGLPGEAIYCASKFAQRGFAESLDYEFRKHNVKVTYLAPGGVKTTFAFGKGRKPGDPILDKMLAPEDVAESVYFVLNQSPKSRVFLLAQRPMGEPL